MLEAHQLACLKGDRLLFRDLDFAFAAGEAVRVRGANGLGKTSLLRILTGLAQPEAGEVRWQGEVLNRVRESFHAALVFLGHAPALSDLLTAHENLRLACRLSGVAADAAGCDAALSRIGLARQRDLPVRVLSQGQRKRVGLARLHLSSLSPLWVLDEPFSALDVDAVAGIARLVDAHCARGGCVVYTTHQDAPLSCRQRDLDLACFGC